jgi:hypothetical protein
MAKLHITELYDLAGVMQIPQMPPIAEQAMDIGATSAASSAFNASTRFVCLSAKADCHIAVGADPTATTGKMPLAAGQSYYFGVTPGHKVAVIQA